MKTMISRQQLGYLYGFFEISTALSIWNKLCGKQEQANARVSLNAPTLLSYRSERGHQCGAFVV